MSAIEIILLCIVVFASNYYISKIWKNAVKNVMQIGYRDQPRVFITMNIKSRLHCGTCSSDIN